jgi:alpha-tubulin suppressor-like RCC1 family protein
MGLTGARSLGLGSPGNHACAVLDGGTVECWGLNSSGQLANGNEIPSNVPVAIPGVTGAVAVAVGGDHTCALIDGGTAECWGFGADGQLGNGANTGVVPTPAPVMGLTGVVAIGAGQNYTCALLSNGTVECWGLNAQGEMGNGTLTNTNTPGVVVGLTGATAIATGSFHVCAVIGDGGVDCWGENNNDQLGSVLDGGVVNEPNVVAVPGLSGVVGVTAGSDHTCALIADGGVDCWGDNDVGQVGNGTTTNNVSAPTPVVGLTGAAIQVAAGASGTCALMASGGIECWGSNQYGALTTASGVPYGLTTTTAVAIPGVTGATAVNVGQNMTCALLSGGTAQCWGWNADGQLGTGQPWKSNTPVPVQ